MDIPFVGRFSLCHAGLESLVAWHVLAEHLFNRIDLTQTVATSKADLIVCTYDMILVRWIIAATVLAEQAEGQLLHWLACHLSRGLHL